MFDMAPIVDNFQPTHFVALLLAIFVSYHLIRILYRATTSPLRSIPGPWYSLYTNLVLKKAVTGGKRIFYIDSLHQNYGSIVRISPTEVAVSDIEAFKQIHAVSSKFIKSIWYDKLTNFPTHSVFTIRDPKKHAARRRVFAKGFSKSYLREHWEPTVREKCQLAVSKIREQGLKEGSVDLMSWWTFMASDIVGCLGFGESFGMLELGHRTEYIRVLEASLVGGGVGAELPWARAVLSRLPIRPLKEAFNSTPYILEHGKVAVVNAKKNIAGGASNNLMSTVLEEAQKEGGGRSSLSDLDVQVEATSLIFAGSGTSANTLTFLTWAILQRPELQMKIEEEVARLPSDLTDKVLEEECPLLNATIEESMRLYAAVPGSLPRVAPPEGATMGGYFIPGGTTVCTQAWTMHRDGSLYEDPHT